YPPPALLEPDGDRELRRRPHDRACPGVACVRVAQSCRAGPPPSAGDAGPRRGDRGLVPARAAEPCDHLRPRRLDAVSTAVGGGASVPRAFTVGRARNGRTGGAGGAHAAADRDESGGGRPPLV